ncbi:dTDP-4-dehydrorhamnose 3,5-epimerase [Acinetobacter baumannii]|uniref:dTDP-4-dehydrorhamnose 3,5-epimerase n=1 Tax=Acinetobacter calcoaceticus/baumannii complex TaxID=909768 RepID=UPI00066D20A3|nr:MULTISPECIES: dTDP-4-dehydrorhamnose 3,5-epimerase [Acinetobacter calcoaceticus/baumannii complex]KMV06493.1 dTDP-4-dehydrorhamnose 3,5-epimerase [Acinetobacter baumannii]MDC5183783.1 dTDP-4-dehydrorhamnose 3,5-epimerase [Acinetobacter baumannii]MDC5427650.1 dTDP-4-dehydrorhamnose 3,5-epimerase [Acinetobacter baumannii]MDM9638318.1 dTDP-4-dehydrorhamnose 3,5-epimerase [Acinetobacter nosocomialis]MDN8152574.1 dTDP-4-dehydrorhamnose 3,5-epimerase [Acinetobacter baumannii]
MNVIETKIKGLLILEPKVFGDDRGWFMESFNQKAFEEALDERGLDIPQFVQDNHSLSQKGVLRGLHYQLNPYAQGKLVRVVQGKAWDVAVDIRKSSPTFGQWVGIELTGENHKQFWIPAGFAHGFVALEDNTQFLYKTTNYYNKESEGAIVWNDPSIAIDWPINNIGQVLVSDKDKVASKLEDAKLFD